uniref:SusC/RagA family TonB-linked outer membrane protein n=1 Tax=Pedobacter schmidteae TaxID=2201271 RepID=UPI000EB417E5|nr:TonB-dependent receptor [Pedobacter schmidteae]
MKNLYICAMCLLMSGFFVPSFAQNEKKVVTLTGKVTDKTNGPLPGVTIMVKEQPGLGTVTNNKGEYTIKADKYQWLVFSYVGYKKKEILIQDKTNIDVVLEDSEFNVMDEVTITGLGAQKKVTVTGAVTTVNVEDLKTPTSSITNALAGNVAGVLAMQSGGQPGSNISEFWIRGISTFGAGTGALVLVDGFERSLSEISIEDIQSFSVLKDASATAIYGSRGANGVVLITTKRGKSDQVSINGKVEGSYNMRTFTPKFVDGYTYASLMNEARITRNQEPFYTPADLELVGSGLDPDIYPNVDWMNMFLKDGAYTKRASLNFNGGGALARYYISGSYINEGGMYATDDALRGYKTNANYGLYNYRSNVDVNLTKTTLVQVGVSGSLGSQNLPGSSYDYIWASLMGQNPISIPIRYSNGLIASRGINGKNNPWVLMTQSGYIENWTNKIQTNVSLEQDLKKLTKGLKFIGRFGFDTNNKNYIRRYKYPESWLAQPQRGSEGELQLTRMTTELLMSQESSASGERMETLQGELHYNREIKDHKLGAIVQYSQDKKVNTVKFGQEATDMIQGIDRRNQRLAGRFTYGYKFRYFVDFNFGYNGSENFARGHQFALFPAVSGAWNVAEEEFVKNKMKWIDMFKLRYSYGKVGNDYMPLRFPYLASFSTSTDLGYNWGDIESNNSYSGLTYNTISSNLVTWEVATKHNLGLDFSFMKDRISGTLDVFREQRDGIYMQRAFVPAIIGLQGANPRANVGSALSQGFDGQMKFSQKIGEVNFTFRGNLTYSKNEVLEADEQYSNYPYIQRAGFRINQNRGLIALGLFKDYEDIRNSAKQTYSAVMPGDIKYKDVNGDGKIDGNDVVPIGATRLPNLIYGFGMSAKWKNFDLNVLFQGAGKSSFFISGYTVYPFSEGNWGNILTDVVESNRWILGENEDVNARYPRMSYGGNSNNYRASTYWLRESSYLRLKTLEAGYTLSQGFTRRVGVKSARLFFMGTNVLTFSSFKLWDPEMNSSNGQQYPLARTYTVGLNVNL